MPAENSGGELAELFLPEDRVLRALSLAARPGYYGNVRLSFRIKPQALEDLVIISEPSQTVRSRLAGEQLAGMGESEREQAVRKKVQELRDRLRMKMDLEGVTFHFEDGHITRFELQEPQIRT